MAFLEFFKTDYVVNGAHRLGFGWANPNHAAAFLACITPLFIPLEGFKAIIPRVVGWAGEVALLLAISLTFSRGAITAVAIAYIWYGLIRSKARGNSIRQFADFVIPHLSLLLISALAIGVFSRFIEIGSDKSVANRLQLWAGGLCLINSSPLTGWGLGESGNAFRHWVQPYSSKELYGGMVNSFLHIAVEAGLPMFFVVTTFLVAPFVFCMRSNEDDSAFDTYVIQSFSSGFIAFLAAAFFSTLWMYASIVWLPLTFDIILLLLFLHRSVSRQDYAFLRTTALCTLVISAAVATCIFMLSFAFGHGERWKIKKGQEGQIYLINRNARANQSICFVPDNRSLGLDYGKEIRKTLELLSLDSYSVIIFPADKAYKPSDEQIVVAFGPKIVDVLMRTKGKFIIAVAPTGPVTNSTEVANINAIGIPSFDQLGFNDQWLKYCSARKTRVTVLPSCGQDVRSTWCSFLKDALIGYDK